MSVSPTSPGDPAGDRPAELQRRIGDAERDNAAGFLQEHMAQGRLTADEFDERISKALGAKTAADLQPLFSDLPEPRPAEVTPQSPFTPPPWSAAGASAVVPAPEPAPAPALAPGSREREHGWPRAAMAAVWPIAIVISFATDFRYWWIWIAAVVATMVIRQGFGIEGRNRQRGIHDGRDRRDGPPSLGG